MLLKQLALAASAAAFLVIPDRPANEASGHDEEVSTLPAHTQEAPAVYVVPQAESVSLPCAECKGDSRLLLDFKVEDAARLTLNGYELYPKADPWHNDLVASEVVGNGDAADQILGYALAVTPRIEDEYLELITVDLRIIEVGQLFVEKVPAVRVNLLKMRNGQKEVFLNRVEVAHAVEAEDSLAQRIKAKFDKLWSKVKSLGKCKHHKGMHHKHHHHDKASGQRYGHGSKGHHGHRGAHGSWAKFFKSITVHIILPVMYGVAASFGVVAVSFLFYIAGLFVVGSRRKNHGRCSRKSKSAPLSEPAFEDEKAGLMEDVEALPPTYEEKPSQPEA